MDTLNSENRNMVVAKKIVLLVFIIVVLFGAFYAFRHYGLLRYFGFSSSSDTWQAVFLSNNQVYFGHLSEDSDDVYRLKDIFYLRINQTLQPSNQQPNVNLVKLGSELHGPDDEMHIPKSQVTFWENMREDSQVVTAIKSFLTK